KIIKDIHCRQIMARWLATALQKKIKNSTLKTAEAYGVGTCENFFNLIKNIHIEVVTTASVFLLAELKFTTIQQNNKVIISGVIIHRSK
ncbi:MAG: hypothetical protein UV05_C0020G0011, partial [candidate division CPR1 bacterium GW2011_GWA2_42_17]